ncbi:MAG: dTDP-4-dehydrorhamnose reductase [Acidobacteriota bacterium]
MNITVIGADGQLGSDICRSFKSNGDSVIELTQNDIEISDYFSVNTVISKKLEADLVINTAAMHNLPQCEKDPASAFRVNGTGAINLANACSDAGIPLLHISTDYVFDGEKSSPYTEYDQPNPLSVYASTKLSGEYFISSISNNYFILRVSGIYGKNICMAKGYNFVDKMLELGKEKGVVRVVDDEILSPTFTEDIAAQIIELVRSKGKPGLYHVAAEGSCSWYEFAKEIFSIKGSDVKVEKAGPGEFANNINRPKYSVLENKNLKDQGLNIMPHWKDGLKRYLTLYR